MHMLGPPRSAKKNVLPIMLTKLPLVVPVAKAEPLAPFTPVLSTL